MTLEGRTLDPDLLAAYLRRLNSERHCAERDLPS